MIIHVVIILFAAVFWNTSVNIICLDNNIILPLSLIILLYIASVYICFKVFFFVKNFTGTVLDNRNKIENAKKNVIQAMLAYIGEDVDYGRKLWQESSKFLQDDKLFLLLSLLNAKFWPEFANNTSNFYGSEGILLKNFFGQFDTMKKSCSKLELVNLFQDFKLPWIFRELIVHYTDVSDLKKANELLKQFWRSGKLSVEEWKVLKSKILLKEGHLAKNKSYKIKSYMRSHKLNKREAVFELIHHYKELNDKNKIKKFIEDVWQIEPSLKLGRYYIDLENDAIAIHKFQQARMISKFNENHPVSHLLIATYAMKSELWAIASEYLHKFKVHYPSLADILLAKLESQKSGNNTKIWNNIQDAFTIIAKEKNFEIDGVI